MRWLQDVTRGEWLKPLIDTGLSSAPTMHQVVPRGFEAYARIFHPVPADRLVGGDWRTHDLQTPWPEIESRLAYWSEVAAFTATIAHPLMQWHAVAHRPLYDTGSLYDEAGWRYSEPRQGQLEPSVLADVAAVLALHTSTPDAGVAAVWEGWGGLRSGGTVLELPQRTHLMVEASISEFASEGWPEAAPWVSHAWNAESPSLIWPDDHAWVLVTEVDFDSTVVAGSRALIDELTRHPLFEALEIAEGADLSWTGDHINPTALGQPDFTGTGAGADTDPSAGPGAG